MVQRFDFLVIGSGIAGMSFALKVASKGKVALVCKTNLEEANTYFAQGGIASVTNLIVDNFDKHIEDTMIAGDWLSDRDAVEKVVRNAPQQIKELISWGVDFDKDEKGNFDLHREGGHSEFRILHHKDNTGAEIQDSLIQAIQKHPNITVFENHFAIEILTQHPPDTGYRMLRRLYHGPGRTNRHLPFQGNADCNRRCRCRLSDNDQSVGSHRRRHSDGLPCKRNR